MRILFASLLLLSLAQEPPPAIVAYTVSLDP